MAKLQEATKTNSKEAFRAYSELADANTKRCLLRGLFAFRTGTSISIDEVEPAVAIVVCVFILGSGLSLTNLTPFRDDSAQEPCRMDQSRKKRMRRWLWQ